MRKLVSLRGIILAGLGLLLAVGTPAHSQRPARAESFTQRLAKKAGVTEDSATRVFTALGPLIREELSRGNEVSVPGLGSFRVVQVAEHKDLRNGRPVTIPAENTIEFLPTEKTVDVANTPNAKPAETVPAFEYIVLPGQTPGQKTGRTRVPPTRTK
jgi:nucleoid DNA-binding protein